MLVLSVLFICVALQVLLKCSARGVDGNNYVSDVICVVLPQHFNISFKLPINLNEPFVIFQVKLQHSSIIIHIVH